jgi:anti-sigma factor RsiW
MCNKENLVGYLYDELSADERRIFEAHLAGCADCRKEVGGLRQTRQHLASWAPPEPEFNFRIVRETPVAPRRRWAIVPPWGLAAAASLLVLAGAAAIANVEIRRDRDGFVVRTGWAKSPATQASAANPPAGPVVPAALDAASSEQLKATVIALERRLADLEQAQTNEVVRASSAARLGISVPEIRKILAESESRQQAELAMRINQVWNDFNVARVSDLERVQQVVANAQGITNYQLKQHRDSINSLYRVSASQVQQK